MTAAEKPPPNPWALKDASGQTLALGERVKQSFAVSRGAESFSFRKISTISLRMRFGFIRGFDPSA